MKDKMTKDFASVNYLKNLKGFSGLVLFAVIITLFHLIYKYFEHDIIKIAFISSILDWVIRMLLISCSWVLNNIFGIKSIINGELLELPNHFKIHMLPGCSGFQQFFLVIMIFTLYPGPVNHKIWYIPLGIIIIYILNTGRFIGISIYSNWHPDHFRFVHDWVFRPFIYFAIFLLWVIWDKYIYRRPVKKK